MNVETMSEKRAQNKFVCTVKDCSLSFSRRDRLAIHKRTHTGERPYICLFEECLKSYARSSHLKRHEATHEQKSIKCSFHGCEAILLNQQTLKKHVDHVHKHLKPKKYKCHYCDEEFNRHTLVKMHEHEHTGIKSYVCPNEDCKRGFITPSRLKRHMKMHEGYSCSKCNPPITCSTWTLYLKHAKIVHQTERRCDICSKSFSSSGNLHMHQKIHQDLNDRIVYFCTVPDCERFYTEKRNMKYHLKRYHEKRPFKCLFDGCALTFKSQTQVDRHAQAHDPTIPISEKKRKKKLKMRKKKQLFIANLAGYKKEDLKDVLEFGTLIEKIPSATAEENHMVEIPQTNNDASTVEASQDANNVITIENKDVTIFDISNCSNPLSNQNSWTKSNIFQETMLQNTKMTKNISLEFQVVESLVTNA